jgi:hypothetical protein
MENSNIPDKINLAENPQFILRFDQIVKIFIAGFLVGTFVCGAGIFVSRI